MNDHYSLELFPGVQRRFQRPGSNSWNSSNYFNKTDSNEYTNSFFQFKLIVSRYRVRTLSLKDFSFLPIELLSLDRNFKQGGSTDVDKKRWPHPKSSANNSKWTWKYSRFLKTWNYWSWKHFKFRNSGFRTDEFRLPVNGLSYTIEMPVAKYPRIRENLENWEFGNSGSRADEFRLPGGWVPASGGWFVISHWYDRFELPQKLLKIELF